MLKIYSDTKIYVHAPSCYVTGGVELLHQLSDFLARRGKQAYIVYFGDDTVHVTPEYKKYRIQIKQEGEIEDSNKNIEVYSETMAMMLKKNQRRTQKLMWWMSVDNFYYINRNSHCIYDMLVWNWKFTWEHVKHRFKMLLKFHNNDFSNKIWVFQFMLKGYTFAYQCEFIRVYLRRFGILKSYPLSDYINLELYAKSEKSQKEDIVLYNPAKGYSFTMKLIAASPDINWIALKGYSRNELQTILKRAKLYVDFGNHPGKDRLPRECAINRCCIITGKKGSAAYYKDVSIPNEYKFDEANVRVEEIVSKIKNILHNYYSVIDDFSDYREKIITEKSIFENEVIKLFNIV